MRSAHKDGDVQTLLHFTSAGKGFPVIGGEEAGNTCQIRLFKKDILCDLFKRSAEMVIMEKGGERTRVRILEVLAQIGKLGGQRNGFAAVPLVIVPDKELDVGKELSYCRLEHAQP
ncbi:hypothetical protein LDC_1887 [sediment metagenome]|uniref:Uncharacterized protein n=1 Tax=sediment metagenome TaxID=749907 RepID=D9PK22_9ZZZZ